MKIVVAQLGARRHYAVPRIFQEAGMLEHFFTDCYVGNKPWLGAGLAALPRRLVPRAVARWVGRTEPSLPASKVTSFDWLGLDGLRRLRDAGTGVGRARVFAEIGQRFGWAVAGRGFKGANAVWGFNGACLELFQVARRQGLRCVMEQTMAPHRLHHRLMRQQVEVWPDWQPGLAVDPGESPLVRREEAEWELADLIVCGSQFVVDGIGQCDGPVEKCAVVPYGVDLERFPFSAKRERKAGDRLHILFVGEVGLRKGVPYLLEALRRLGPDTVEARFAGGIALARDKLSTYSAVAEFLGPVPRARMTELFAWADVFVLPSLCEGSAAVTYEAVVSGLPVICTPNTGALPSAMVTVVPARDVDALTRALSLEARRSRSEGGSQDVRSEYGLEAYANRLLATVAEIRSVGTVVAAE